MGQIVSDCLCKKNYTEEKSEVMATSTGNEDTPQETGDVPEPFDFTTCTLNSLDQYEMEKQMAALEHNGIEVILNDDKTFRLEGKYVNVEKAIEQLKELRMKVAGRSTSEKNEEQLSNNPEVKPKVERSRVLRKDLTPSIKHVDLSTPQKILIDPHVWYYLKCKHPHEVDIIDKKHMCISRVVFDSSNEGITHCLEVAPYALEDSDEAKKHVDDAIEEFATLYQKVSEPGIVKESIKLPLVFDKGMTEHLIRVVEEMGVFFLRSDDPCLVGPKACVEEAKRKVTDLFRGKNDSPAQRQPNNNFGSSPASAANQIHSLNFVTPNGLKVYVSKGDLVRQSLDAIVNPANERLGHGGGAARAIADAAGYVLEKESKNFIREHGKLGIAHVMHTSAGNLQPKIKYVIHTVGPRKSDVKDEQELLDLVRCTVLNTLLYANDELKIHSVAIPAISSGIFGVPLEIVGRASFEALDAFDNYCASRSKTSLHEIHFLNKDEATFSHMKRIFERLRKDNRESSVDPPESRVMDLLDRYAEVFGRRRIETMQHDGCFTRALATALQEDFQSKLDSHKVEQMIRKEVDNNEDYKKFRTEEETGKQWSWADVVKNPWDVFANNFLNGDKKKGINPDLWINGAANALEVQIVLVLLSAENEPVERQFEPRSNVKDRTVFVAYHYCGHHHFDALVKISSLEGSASGKNMSKSLEATSAGIIKNSSNPGHSQITTNELSQTHKNDDDFVKLSLDEIDGMPPDKTSDPAGKKDTQEKASTVAGKKADDEKASPVAGKMGTDDKKEDDDNHCIICMDDITDKKELPCKHKFCRECIDNYFAKCQPKCPSCGKVFGTLKGDQPKGTMSFKESSWQHLPGYNGCGTIEIEYYFGDGIQGENHPNPGQQYRGTHRTAYLPANKEGREVLRLLRSAFDAGLVFTIGRSNTTGRDNVVIWNDVHHKTSPNGQYGYPDPTYLKRVKEELAAKGIQ